MAGDQARESAGPALLVIVSAVVAVTAVLVGGWVGVAQPVPGWPTGPAARVVIADMTRSRGVARMWWWPTDVGQGGFAAAAAGVDAAAGTGSGQAEHGAGSCGDAPDSASLGLSSTGGDRLVSVTRKVLLTSDDRTC